jgi:hypothetical protein
MGASTFLNPTSVASALQKFSPTLLGVASLLCFTALPSAHAETYVPAIRFNPLKTKSVSGTGNLLGYHFTTEEDRTIKGVGIWDTTPTNNRVGIWDYTGIPTLLFQAPLPSPSNCVNRYCWISAADLPGLPLLEQNKDYVIAVSWNNTPVPANMAQNDLLLIAGFSTSMNAYLDPFDAMTNLNDDLMGYFPSESNAPDGKSFFTAMLSFEVVNDTVQTPTPLPLFGAAAAFGWTRKIRGRIKSST